MRIRTIKPEFWSNEELSSISAEAALLAIGLLNYADDEGYFNANPKLVSSSIFPIRETSGTTTVLLRELSDIGYIKLYTAGENKMIGHIVNFKRHQVINKPKASNYKAFINDTVQLPYEYGTDTVLLPSGREGNGKEMEWNNTPTPQGAAPVVSDEDNAIHDENRKARPKKNKFRLDNLQATEFETKFIRWWNEMSDEMMLVKIRSINQERRDLIKAAEEFGIREKVDAIEAGMRSNHWWTTPITPEKLFGAGRMLDFYERGLNHVGVC